MASKVVNISLVAHYYNYALYIFLDKKFYKHAETIILKLIRSGAIYDLINAPGALSHILSQILDWPCALYTEGNYFRAIRIIASRDFSTSSSVVTHELTLMRIARSPCQVVPPHQHVPSS